MLAGAGLSWAAAPIPAPHVADRLLNHVRGTISGVAAVYQRQEFLAERKAALEAWAGHVVGLAKATSSALSLTLRPCTTN